MKPWGFEDLEDASFCLSEPQTDNTSTKRVYGERQPFIQEKGLAPIDGGGDRYYFRWNSDTIHLFRYALSTDDLSRFNKAELKLWYDFIEYEDYYSHSPLEGYIGATTIDENGYSYCVPKSGYVDYEAFAWEPLQIRPYAVMEQALDALMMALIDDDIDIITEQIFNLPVLECPTITTAINYVEDNPAETIEGVLETPPIQPTITYPSKKTVDYHTTGRSRLDGNPLCPPNIDVFLNPCDKGDVSLVNVDTNFTKTSYIGGDIDSSFDENLATYWWVDTDADEIVVDLEFEIMSFFRWMTITAQTSDFDRVTRNFQVLGWDEFFNCWKPMSRRFVVDTAWESEVAKPFELRGLWAKKLRIHIFDARACLGANVEFFSNRPEVLDGQNQVSTFFCHVDWNLLSIEVNRTEYNKVDLGYPVCPTPPTLDFEISNKLFFLPTLSKDGDNGGYQVSETGRYSNYYMRNMVDKDDSSRAVIRNNVGGYVEILSPFPHNPYGYKMNFSQYDTQNATGWILWGTKDYLTWEKIDEKSGEAPVANSTVEYEFNTPELAETYWGFRIEISGLGTGGTYGEIDSFDMFSDFSQAPDSSNKPIFYTSFTDYVKSDDGTTWSVFESDYNSGNSAEGAFDGSISDEWGVDSPTDEYVGLMTEELYTIKRFDITASDDNLDQLPKNFDIQGSNNGLDYKTIASYTNKVFSENEKKYYTLNDNEEAFKYHRIYVHNNNGNSTYTVISDLEFFRDMEQNAEVVWKPFIPNMSADTESFGTAIASSMYNSSYQPYKAFDSSISSVWASNGDQNPTYIGYIHGTAEPKVCNMLKLINRNGYQNEQPHLFAIEGTKDGSNWEHITRIWEAQYPYAYRRNYYYFDNSEAYVGYRLIVDEGYGSSNFSFSTAQFYELENWTIEPYIDWLIEKHRGATEPTGTVTAESVYANDETYAYKAFDYDIESDYRSANGTLTGWIKYEFTEPTVADVYGIRASDNERNRHPITWHFEGSNDDENWTILDSQTQLPKWEYDETREFTFENTVAYKYYRLNVLEVDGDNQYIQFNSMNIGKIKGNQTNKFFDDNGYRDVTPYRNDKEGWSALCQIMSQHHWQWSENHGYPQLFHADKDRKVAVKANEFDLQLKYYESPKIQKYEMEGRNNSNLDEMISEWTFQGSNDGVNWDILDSQTGQSFTAYQVRTYEFTNNNYYKYYRVLATDSNGATDYWGMGKMRLYEKE